MIIKRKFPWAKPLSVMLSLALSSQVIGQERGGAEAPADAGRSQGSSAASLVSEIIITARRRDESFLDVPVVAATLSGERMEKEAINDLYSFTAKVPSLLMGLQSGVLGPQISLRGVGTTAANATIDQSVSLNIDGLQLTQGFAYEAGLFDLAQAEVLKGPQALFFGKNTPAGLISLRSADPGDETEVVLRAGYEFEARKKQTEAIFSGLVTPTLGLRLAMRYSDDDGFFRNRTTAPEGFGVRTPTTRDFASTEDWVVRGTALFTPTDSYKARLKINYLDKFIDNGGGSTQLASCPGGLESFTGLPVFDPNEDCRTNRDTYISWLDPEAFPLFGNKGIPFTDIESWFGTLDQDFTFGSLTLTSLTGFYDFSQLATGNGGEVSGMTPLAPRNSFDHDMLTQEIRLTSDFDGPVNFMLGGFYEDATMKNHVRIYGNQAIQLPAVLQDVAHTIDISSVSGFGQIQWAATEQLEVSVGARVTREKRRHKQVNVGTAGMPLGPTPLLKPRISFTNVSPEVSITYQPTDNLTAFASYREGFKSGSFNTVVTIDPTTNASFGDETVKGGEIGLKAVGFDNRMMASIAAYHYHYKGLQVGAAEVTPSGIIAFRTLNAASANVRGVEMDMTYMPAMIDGLTLRGAINYNHARYDRFNNAPCGNNQTIVGGCDQLYDPVSGTYNAQDLSGTPLVRAPEWVVNAGFDYDFPLRNGWEIGIGANAMHSSSYVQSVVNLPGYKQDAYAKVDARIALRDARGAWEVALIGTNLNNEITAASCFNANLNGAVIFGGQISGAENGGPAGDDYKVCAPERGRAVWLQFTYRPFAM